MLNIVRWAPTQNNVFSSQEESVCSLKKERKRFVIIVTCLGTGCALIRAIHCQTRPWVFGCLNTERLQPLDRYSFWHLFLFEGEWSLTLNSAPMLWMQNPEKLGRKKEKKKNEKRERERNEEEQSPEGNASRELRASSLGRTTAPSAPSAGTVTQSRRSRCAAAGGHRDPEPIPAAADGTRRRKWGKSTGKGSPEPLLRAAQPGWSSGKVGTASPGGAFAVSSPELSVVPTKAWHGGS